MFTAINMPPKKQSIPDTRPSFMISFDPTHAYNEVDELTRNQRRKYNRHMRLVRTEPEAAATKTQTYEEVVQTGNDEEGDDSDEKGGKISSEGAEERGGNDSEMDLDRPESPELQTVSSGWRKYQPRYVFDSS